MTDFKATHKGQIFGCIPVLLDMTDEQVPGVAPRWFWVEPFFWIAELLFGCAVFLRTMVDPEYEPLFPIKITGEVDGEEG